MEEVSICTGCTRYTAANIKVSHITNEYKSLSKANNIIYCIYCMYCIYCIVLYILYVLYCIVYTVCIVLYCIYCIVCSCYIISDVVRWRDGMVSFVTITMSRCLVHSCSPLSSQVALSAHSSQMVWFRQLYMIFSRYMFINTFKKLIK